jgi:anaerobic ribonucleoside-triphosphate reductase
MIKDAEVAMVHAANYALEAQERNVGASVDDVIKHFLMDFSTFDIKPGLKLYSIAAISEIMKLKANRENKGKTNKQLLQMFVNNVPEFLRRLHEDENSN